MSLGFKRLTFCKFEISSNVRLKRPIWNFTKFGEILQDLHVYERPSMVLDKPCHIITQYW